MADFEVHVDLHGRTRSIGLARSNRVRGTETILFEYDPAWLDDPDRFSLEPALALTRGAFAPAAGLAIFGSIGDSAPDTWGRRLMQRAARRLAQREGRAVRSRSRSGFSVTRRPTKTFSSSSRPVPPSVVRGRRRRSSTDMAISPSQSFRRRPTNTASKPGRRSRCGWPARRASPPHDTNSSKWPAKRSCCRDASIAMARSASLFCPQWR